MPEIELRTSGALDGMIRALQRLFASENLHWPLCQLLGLLPSLGGARFLAPIVEAASRNTDLTKEHKAAINFWFRHIFEFSSPIIPGMIMACSIAGVAFSDFIAHLCWLTLLAFALGWLVLIRPLDMPANSNVDVDPAERRQDIMNLVLSLAPVVINFLLVVFCDLNASTAMALVTFAMIPVLRMTSRVLNIKEVYRRLRLENADERFVHPLFYPDPDRYQRSAYHRKILKPHRCPYLSLSQLSPLLSAS
ncbi:MAG: DUF401 family protein [Phascolarctobacterium faecium]